MIEYLQSARLVEHNIIGEIKSQFVIGNATLRFLPLHSSGILSTLHILFTLSQ